MTILSKSSGNRMVTDEVQTIYYPAATLEGNYSDPNANSMVNHETFSALMIIISQQLQYPILEHGYWYWLQEQ